MVNISRCSVGIFISLFTIPLILLLYFLPLIPLVQSFCWQIILFYLPGFAILLFDFKDKISTFSKHFKSVLLSIAVQFISSSVFALLSIYNRLSYTIFQIIFWSFILSINLYLYLKKRTKNVPEGLNENKYRKGNMFDLNKHKNTITFVIVIILILIFQNIRIYLRSFPTDRFSYAFVTLVNSFADSGSFSYFFNLEVISPLDNAYVSVLSFPTLIICNAALVLCSNLLLQDTMKYILIGTFFIALSISSSIENMDIFSKNQNGSSKLSKIEITIFLISLIAPDTLYRIFTNPTGGGHFVLMPYALLFFSLALKIRLLNSKMKVTKYDCLWILTVDWILALSYKTHFAVLVIMNAVLALIFAVTSEDFLQSKIKLRLYFGHFISQVLYLTLLIIYFIVSKGIVILIPISILDLLHFTTEFTREYIVFLIPILIILIFSCFLITFYIVKRLRTNIKSITKKYFVLPIKNTKRRNILFFSLLLLCGALAIILRYGLIGTNLTPINHLHPAYNNSSVNNIVTILTIIEYILLLVVNLYFISHSLFQASTKKFIIKQGDMYFWYLVLIMICIVFSPLIFLTLGAQYVLTRSLYYVLSPMLVINIISLNSNNLRKIYLSLKKRKIIKLLKHSYLISIVVLSLSIQCTSIYSPISDDLSMYEYEDIVNYFSNLPEDSYIFSDLRISNAMMQISGNINFWILNQNSPDFGYLLDTIFYNYSAAKAFNAFSHPDFKGSVGYILLSQEFMERGIVIYDYWYEQISLTGYQKFWNETYFNILVEGNVLTLIELQTNS